MVANVVSSSVTSPLSSSSFSWSLRILSFFPLSKFARLIIPLGWGGIIAWKDWFFSRGFRSKSGFCESF